MAAPTRLLTFVNRKVLKYFPWASAKLHVECNNKSNNCVLFSLNRIATDRVVFAKQRSSTNERCKVDIKTYPWILAAAAVAIDTTESDEKDDKKAKDSKDDEIVLIIKHAKLAEYKQDFEKADQLYHKALAMLTLFGQNKTWTEDKLIQARVYVYDSMANLALSSANFQKAETLFKETLRGLLQQGYSKEDNAIVEISLKLAMIYAMLNRVEESDEGYQYCIKILENKIDSSEAGMDDDTVALLGLTIDSYSRFLLVQSKLPQALATMRKAMDIAKKVFGDVHPQIAVLYNDIATVLSLMKDLDSAKEHVLQAVTMAQKLDSPDLPSFLCNLGAIHMHKLDVKSAEQTCRKALKSADKYQNKSAYSQAEKCLEEIKKKKKQGKA